MKLKHLFYHGNEQINFQKELLNGFYLFIIAMVMIQWNADLLRTSFESDIFNAIIPVLLFMLCGFSGLFTLLQGLLFKKPLLVLPNLLLSVLIAVYGTYSMGYSINHVMIAAFIAILFSFLLFLLLPESWIQQLIPSSLSRLFPAILGLLLVIIGLIKAGFIIRFFKPDPSSLVSATSLSDWQFPFRAGYLFQPIPLLVIAGFILLGLTKKKSIFHSPWMIFILLTVIGFFIPVEWGRATAKGMVTSYQRFSFITSSLKPSNFSMFFTNWQIASIKNFFNVLTPRSELIKLVFLFAVTFIFSQLHQFQTLQQLWKKPGDDQETSSKTSLMTKKVYWMNHLYSFFGVSTNVAFFMTSAESGVAIDQSSHSGFSAVFSGLLLMAVACMIPLGFFSSQAGSSFLVLYLGFSLINKGIQPLLQQKYTEWVAPVIFLLVTLFTFNPAEGLVMAILVDGVKRLANGIQEKQIKELLNPGFIISFILCILYVCFFFIERS